MNQTQQRNDTAKERRLQVVLPLDLGLRLPEDKSLNLLIEITEGMDYRELYAAYERREAAGEAAAKQLFQLVVFGFLNGYYSLRSISAACRYDVRMMYLLQGRRRVTNVWGISSEIGWLATSWKTCFISLSRSCWNKVIFRLPICL